MITSFVNVLEVMKKSSLITNHIFDDVGWAAGRASGL